MTMVVVVKDVVVAAIVEIETVKVASDSGNSIGGDEDGEIMVIVGVAVIILVVNSGSGGGNFDVSGSQ